MKFPLSVTGFTALLAATTASLLSGCSSPLPPAQPGQGAAPSASALATIERAETTSDGTSTARSVDAYKRDIALRISQVNSTKVYPGQPQALMRSIIVVKFSVDANGRLLRSDIVRTNHDNVTEATALSALRNTAPFPKPAASLLHNGRLEITETFLFNNDGRFQVRSVAQKQLDQ